MIGARVMMNNGFNDWNHDAGTVKPKISLFTNDSVYNVNELPACSKPAQKNTTKQAIIKTALVRCFSLFVSGFACLDVPWGMFCSSNWDGFFPTWAKYLLLKLLNKICPITIPIEEDRKAHL